MINLEKELAGSFILEESGQDIWIFRLEPKPEWTYFTGHFPDQAVLPAVAIIDISHFLISKIQHSERIAKVENFRIRNPVLPEVRIMVTIQQESPGSFQIHWRRAEDPIVVAELNLKMN